MPEPILPTPLFIIFFSVLVIALFLVLWRIVKGPHVLDRLMCLDMVALIIICMMTIWELAVGTKYFFDAVLVLAVTGFISTVALAKYLEDGEIID